MNHYNYDDYDNDDNDDDDDVKMRKLMLQVRRINRKQVKLETAFTCLYLTLELWTLDIGPVQRCHFLRYFCFGSTNRDTNTDTDTDSEICL